MSKTAAQDQIAKGARVGVVQTDARDKTRKVVIEYQAQHPKYGKYVQRRTVLHAHDENNESARGDKVEIVPCRPMSKTKSWTITRVVEKHVGDE